MKRWQRVFERLDRLSRDRALTDQESEMLERAIGQIDGTDAALEPTASGKRWASDEEQRFRAMIADGVMIREAGRRLGKSAGAAVGKWKRVREAGL